MATVASSLGCRLGLGLGLGLGPLEVRLRREARGSRAQARGGLQERPAPAPAPAQEPRSPEECSKELASWLQAISCFVLGPAGQRYVAQGLLQSEVASSAKVFDPMEVLEEEFYAYEGGKDLEREVHGTGVMEYEDGSCVAGCWEHGVRQGAFRVDTNRGDSEVSYLEGQFLDDLLSGMTRLQRRDGRWEEGWYRAGVRHGFWRFFSPDKQLTGVGMFRNGRLFGTFWRMVAGGGYVVGRVDEQGELTGPDLAYLYPGLRTGLVGAFLQGELVAGRRAALGGLQLDYGALMVPHFTPGEGPMLPREIANSEEVTCLPLEPDPYESLTVEVRQSSLPGAEEGLFTRLPLQPQAVLAFYNGLRIRRSGSVPQTWQTEENAYKIFDPSCKEGVVNIPPKYHKLSDYCASLAHKTNHSFDPNCEFGEFLHPRWGLVPCIVAKHFMEAGEEAFVSYGYDLDWCPDWYLEAWERKVLAVPDSMRSAYGLS